MSFLTVSTLLSIARRGTSHNIFELFYEVTHTAEATLKCNIRYLSMGGPKQFGRQCYAAPLDIFHRSIMYILAEYPLALPDADICTSCYTADGYADFDR